MDLSGEVRLNASRERVWDALNDPAVLQACIPGCEAMERTSDTEFTATVVSRVGPIKARFQGKVGLTDVDPPHRYTLVGEGHGGMAGFAKADIGVSLEAVDADATLLRYGVQANVGGRLAQLGARLIDATARKSADAFFERFAAEIRHRYGGDETTAAAPDAAPDVAPAAPPPASPPPAAPVDEASAVDVLLAGHVKIEIAEQVAVVTLNRPQQRNAMTSAMWRAMPALFASLGRDPAVRVIVLTGAGGDFCAGADIAEFATVRDDVDQATAYEVAVDACCDAITDSAKPVIAVIDGYCLGGGAHLAMSCDFRYAAATAKFGIPAARLSVVYGVGGTRKLLALVGLSTAKKILYGGERFDAAEARRIGFVDQVAGTVETEGNGGWFAGRKPAATADAMTEARAFAKIMARNAPLTIVGAKAILNDLGLDASTLDPAKAAALIVAAAGSDDYREGRAAFAEKRDPVFKGR